MTRAQERGRFDYPGRADRRVPSGSPIPRRWSVSTIPDTSGIRSGTRSSGPTCCSMSRTSRSDRSDGFDRTTPTTGSGRLNGHRNRWSTPTPSPRSRRSSPAGLTPESGGSGGV